jgi:DNA-binding GntR family transcriptional regulator
MCRQNRARFATLSSVKKPPNNSEASKPLRDVAYDGLRRLLILQQVVPGTRLREPEWSRKLGVNRTALREAFARLEAEGLIERGPATGYFVPKLTDADVLEVTKLRILLECFAIDEICARKVTPLHSLVGACKELAQFIRGRYSLGAMEADRRFHEALIDAARIRRLSALYLRAPLPLIERHTEDPILWQKEYGRTLAEHQQMLTALKQRNAAKAKRLLRSHLMHRPRSADHRLGR